MADNHRKHVERSVLAEVLPLDTPYTIHVDVCSACNFRCRFCFHSLSPEELSRQGFRPGVMDLATFRTTVDRIREFPSKLHRLCLIRHGESLLNRDLPALIRYAKDQDVARRVNISTNGSLLTPDLAAELVASGIDEVLVSIEALSDDGYREVSRAPVDFGSLVDNVRALYELRGRCTVNVKIIDAALGDGDEERFHELFDPICDMASVECIVPCFRGVDYAAVKTRHDVNIMGDDFVDARVCPQPFFQLHIFPNGSVSVCNADYNEGLVFGNVARDSLLDIWKGEELNAFRRMHLRGERREHAYCSYCAGNVCYSSQSDILDDAAERLLRDYE